MQGQGWESGEPIRVLVADDDAGFRGQLRAILMLTASDEEEDLYAAVTAWANGYLLKDASLHEVTGAVRAVMAGHSLVSPAMAAKLLTEFQALPGASSPPPSLPGRCCRSESSRS